MEPRTKILVRLDLSAESASNLAIFFSHNKLVNNTFCHNLKRHIICNGESTGFHTRLDNELISC